MHYKFREERLMGYTTKINAFLILKNIQAIFCTSSYWSISTLRAYTLMFSMASANIVQQLVQYLLLFTNGTNFWRNSRCLSGTLLITRRREIGWKKWTSCLPVSFGIKTMLESFQSAGSWPCTIKVLKSAEIDGAISSANVCSIQTDVLSGPEVEEVLGFWTEWKLLQEWCQNNPRASLKALHQGA